MTAFFTVFFSIFFAELGDKTQLATLFFAADGKIQPRLVFLSASAALICSTAIAVLFGGLADKYLAFLPLKLIAGVGFIAIGGFMVGEYFLTRA